MRKCSGFASSRSNKLLEEQGHKTAATPGPHDDSVLQTESEPGMFSTLIHKEEVKGVCRRL